MQSPSTPCTYCIVIEGELDPGWSNWLNGLSVVPGSGEPATTTLAGPVRDQAALRSLLNRLWNMNLTLVSVNRVDEPHSGG